jgi:hypothetical protein
MIVLVVCLGLTQQDALEERKSVKQSTLQFRRPSATQGDLEAGVEQPPVAESSANTLTLSSSDCGQSQTGPECSEKPLQFSLDTQT